MDAAVRVVIVNYNSGWDCARLLRQLARQQDVDLDIVVIDSASRDDSLQRAKDVAGGMPGTVRFVEPGCNVGYTGNNLAMGAPWPDLLILNPDVDIDDASTISELVALLAADPRLGALAPHIRTDQGIEYTDSVLDLDRARAHHQPTYVEAWPHPEPVHPVAWLNGAAWLLRGRALEQIGGLDERFFLFFEEVDWCIRARGAGWTLGLSRDVGVEHRRSSSFRGTKGAFYYWRNLHLLCSKHGSGWQRSYLRRLTRENLRPGPFRRGETRRAWQGYRAARAGRFGPAPEDAAPTRAT